jgi:GNAT superfamily N-acetyltransferase
MDTAFKHVDEIGRYDATPLASRWAEIANQGARGTKLFRENELAFCVVKHAAVLVALQKSWNEFNRLAARPQFFWPAVFSFNRDAVSLALINGAGFQAVMQIRESHNVCCVAGSRGPLIYVSFLEVAPWNKAEFPRRQFHGLGSFLLQLAGAWSLDRGLGGAVALHALPEAVQFYLKLGFTTLDCPNEHHELYFELDAASATGFRQRGGLL